jgi:uncharacterized membrane protein (UPF0127 family)
MKYILLFLITVIFWLQFVDTVVQLWEWKRYIELAQSKSEQEAGLMHRESMNKNKWMLFIFETENKVNFWMKNTVIPLDMIFLDWSWIVQKIHYWAIPQDTTLISWTEKTKYVLEILSGQAHEWNIHTWDIMWLRYWLWYAQ